MSKMESQAEEVDFPELKAEESTNSISNSAEDLKETEILSLKDRESQDLSQNEDEHSYIEEYLKKIEMLENELSEVKAQNQKLEDALEVSESKCSMLEQGLEDMMQTCKETEQMKEETLRELQEKHEELKEYQMRESIRVTFHRERREDEEVREASLSVPNESDIHVTPLRKEIEELQEEKQRTAELMQAMELEILSLKNERSVVESEKLEIQKQNAEFEKELEDMKRQTEELLLNNQELSNQISAYQSQNVMSAVASLAPYASESRLGQVRRRHSAATVLEAEQSRKSNSQTPFRYKSRPSSRRLSLVNIEDTDAQTQEQEIQPYFIGFESDFLLSSPALDGNIEGIEDKCVWERIEEGIGQLQEGMTQFEEMKEESNDLHDVTSDKTSLESEIAQVSNKELVIHLSDDIRTAIQIHERLEFERRALMQEYEAKTLEFNDWKTEHLKRAKQLCTQVFQNEYPKYSSVKEIWKECGKKTASHVWNSFWNRILY